MHLSLYQLNRYRHARLAPTELLALDDHLMQCDFCRQQLRAQVNPQAAWFSLQANLHMVAEDDHLLPAQLAAFQHHHATAVERELIASHLECCAICSAQLQAHRTAETPSAPSFSGWPDWRDGRDWWLAWRDWVAMLWPMPVAAVLALALVSVADRFYPRPTAQAEQASAPLPVASPAAANPVPEASAAPPRQAVAAEQLARLTFPPQLAALRGETTTRGNASDAVPFRLTHPIATFVLPTRPTLRWQALPGATHYRVNVFSAGYELIAESPALLTTNWTLPISLTRSQTYLWQVTATKNDEEIIGTAPFAEAKFAVLSEVQARQFAQAQRRATSRPARAALAAQVGLLDEAEALLQASPPTPATRQLLQQIQQQRKK